MQTGRTAEVYGLSDRGTLEVGTVYVTLEPCSHHGRTAPCCDALVTAKISRVVAAMQDPNPLVNGGGLEKLKQAGVQTECGILENEARELNIGFISRIARGRPWVRMKIAASLDGKTALNNGKSRWITGAAARADSGQFPRHARDHGGGFHRLRHRGRDRPHRLL